MIIGIIGLPQSGKTTLFNVLCGTHQETGGYTAKGEVHHGVVKVPDARLGVLAEIYKPKKITHAEIEWMDVAGFTGDTSDRARVDTEIPNAIREAFAIAHVVRAFDDPKLPHPAGSVDPERDIKAVEDELIFSDLVGAEKRLEKVERHLKVSPDDTLRREKAVLEKCLEQLNTEKPLREVEFTPDEQKAIKGFQFLSIKPVLIILNIGENRLPDRAAIQKQFAPYDEKQWCAVEVISAKVQSELAELDPDDRKVFMDDLGITGFALDRIVGKSYELLGLISYLTGGDKEVHAWTINRGTTAVKAAGVIHKDFEKGFIKAEIVAYDKLVEAGSEAEAKKHGWMRLEGKEYIVKDGDVIFFRFNV
ncbi:MAG: redox-regulated ATPase YchF [candidate division Zixibacteria bacterium]|nr:redox-regulated ATPase YchF [candidate division Zixibacteria bacterium]MBU1471278.1 redox-regulated ATPase YchF [candidate division Zixibacteria bacterium]MBU2625791.1 redox-regulated ATPase YchF [candidate division Zixibacteria bacterium]